MYKSLRKNKGSQDNNANNVEMDDIPGIANRIARSFMLDLEK